MTRGDYWNVHGQRKSTIEGTTMTIKQVREFLDASSPTGDRDSRREAIVDYASSLEDQAVTLKVCIAQNNLVGARKAFQELQGWLEAIGDNLRG
jgi:hypothetical protein